MDNDEMFIWISVTFFGSFWAIIETIMDFDSLFPS